MAGNNRQQHKRQQAAANRSKERNQAVAAKARMRLDKEGKNIEYNWSGENSVVFPGTSEDIAARFRELYSEELATTEYGFGKH